jgi:DNA-binding response OmpR family regulator
MAFSVYPDVNNVLTEFEGSTFDLAIVDIFLQASNGLDVIGKMRERIPSFPIVAISGMTTLDFVLDAPELFNVICLQKPFRPAELFHAIEAACGLREAPLPDRERVYSRRNVKRPGEPGRLTSDGSHRGPTIPSD